MPYGEFFVYRYWHGKADVFFFFSVYFTFTSFRLIYFVFCFVHIIIFLIIISSLSSNYNSTEICAFIWKQKLNIPQIWITSWIKQIVFIHQYFKRTYTVNKYEIEFKFIFNLVFILVMYIQSCTQTSYCSVMRLLNIDWRMKALPVSCLRFFVGTWQIFTKKAF